MAIIRAARFRGVTRGDFIDSQDIEGDLINQIEQGVIFAIRNTSNCTSRLGVRRQENPDYPIVILREIITNAVTHREYSIKNESIQLAIFDDRIEITSPSGLPGSLTVENIIDRQHSRNPILAKRLFEMEYLEAWGLGIDTIVNWSRKEKRQGSSCKVL